MMFSDWMKNIRKENNLTQSQLAQILDVSVETIKKIEIGQTKIPSTKLTKHLSEYLHLTEPTVLQAFMFGTFEGKLEGGDRQLVEFGLNYLCYKYLDGWTINKYMFDEELMVLGPRNFMGELTKKKDPKYNVIVDQFERYEMFFTPDKLDDIDYRNGVITTFFNVLSCFPRPIKELHVLFDSREDSDLKHYYIMKQYQRIVTVVPIYFILYDCYSSQVIEQYRIL